ncbi:hypothetical protein [Haloarcula sp. 1CSR25-25]|uniref:hypothetical protein n=1 Tax=Haloarcula sp. 1CSR25-25 TaxID=2862545 RepID=UPI00289D37C1|nr:hypothetical protein [Haloarcula sp. 1CSR25-25]
MDAYVKEGKVVVEYKGEHIRTLSPEEAIECGGDIATVGKIAKRGHGNRPKDSSYPDNSSASHSSANIEREHSRDDEEEDEEDWRGPNKNSLIDGPL